MRRIKAISIAIGLSVIALGVALGLIGIPKKPGTAPVQAAPELNKAVRIPEEANVLASDQDLPSDETLTPDEWTSLQAQMRRAQYQFMWQVREDDGHMYGAYRAPNRAHNLNVALSTTGLRVTRYGHRSETSPNRWSETSPHRSANRSWEVGLRLVTYGKQHFPEVIAEDALHGTRERVTYHWSTRVTEWYENRPEGVKHGLTLIAPPSGTPSDNVTLTFALQSNLTPDLDATGQGIRLRDANGHVILLYDQLLVTDAESHILPAHIVLEKPDASRITFDVSRLTSHTFAIVIDDTTATYPIKADPLLHSETVILHASEGQAYDFFGTSVSISGDTLAVGAYEEDGGMGDPLTSAGAVYVFARNRGGADTWGEIKILRASDAQSPDQFGYSISLSGDTLAVGARYEDGGTGDPVSNAGAVYIFARNQGGADNWGEVQILHASDMQEDDYFGESVSISGDTLVVGTPYEDGGTGNPVYRVGAAYVFARNQGGADNWGEIAILHPSDMQTNDNFGGSVAISGDILVVGASHEDGGVSDPATNAGAAYVFARNQGGANAWGEVKALHASDMQTDDYFGISVSISGDTLIVGAYGEDGGAGDPASWAGAAYLFTRNQGGADNWGEVTILHASDPQTQDYFGESVSISGDTLIVGANAEDGGEGDPVSSAGTVYVFARNQGGADTWGEVTILRASDMQVGDRFGEAVSISGDTLVVGAFLEDGGPGDPITNTGAAYVFTREDGAWHESISLHASDMQALDGFGYAVSASGDVLVVGAPNEDGGVGDPITDTGAAYLFTRNQGGADVWGEVTILRASDAQAGDGFGKAVSVNGDTVVIGANEEDGGTGDPATDAGAAYIFTRNQGGADTWGEVTILHASDMQVYDRFGSAVSINGDTAIVGTPYENGGAGDPATDAGAAYVFARNQGGVDTWGEVTILHASDAQAYDEFGKAVSIWGDTVAIGAFGEDGGVGDPITNTGAAYVFARNQGGADVWGEVQILHASDAQAGDQFGRSAGLSGDVQVIGADGEDGGVGDPASWAGAAYIFSRNQGGADQWDEVQTLHASDMQAGDSFGIAASANGERLLIGAWKEDGGPGDPTSQAGAAYVFARNQGGADQWGEAQILRTSDRAANDFFGYAVGLSDDTAIVGAYSQDGGSGNPIHNTGAAYVFTLQEPKPDLAITKHVSANSVPPGTPITYALTFANIGTITATGVVISDVVPSGQLVDLSFKASGAVITATGNISYTWLVTDLAPGQEGVITITGTLAEPLAAGTLTNTVTITSTAGDSNPDNNEASAAAIVQNVAPVAMDDAYATPPNTPLVIAAPDSILSNDYDANGDPLTAMQNSTPTVGTLMFNNNGTFVYTPSLDYQGTVTFTYRAYDGDFDSNTALVTISISEAADFTRYHPTFCREFYGLNATLYVQNPTDTIANVVLTFDDMQGTLIPQHSEIDPQGTLVVRAEDHPDLSNQVCYALIVTADQPVRSVVREYNAASTGDTLALYRGYDRPDSLQYAGPFYKAYTNAGPPSVDSNLSIWNVATVTATVQISVYDLQGSVASETVQSLPAGGQYTLLPFATTLPDEFAGWVNVEADQAVITHLFLSSTSDNAIGEYRDPVKTIHTTVTLPRVFKAVDEGNGPRTTTLFAVNPGPNEANATLMYAYYNGVTPTHTSVFTLPAHGATVANLAAETALADGEIWAVTLDGDQAMFLDAMTYHDVTAHPAGTYGTETGESLALPGLTRSDTDYTVFSLQNIGADNTMATISYHDVTGTLMLTETVVLAPGEARRYHQQDYVQLGDAFEGSAVIEATQPIMAWVDAYIQAPPPSDEGLTALSIAGPTSGTLTTAYRFTATVSPVTATTPITYVWYTEQSNIGKRQASNIKRDSSNMIGQTSKPVTLSHVSGITDTAAISWTTSGVHVITVTATNALNAVSATHTITIVSAGAPLIAITPEALTKTLETGTTATTTLVIRNDGDGDLTWSLQEQPAVAWLSPDRTGGVLAPDDPLSNSLRFDATALSNGVYTTVLRITSDAVNTPQVAVPVTLTVSVSGTCIALEDVHIDGPTEGYPHTTYTFTVAITPSNATPPFTYTWSNDGLVSGQGTAQATYRWSSAGSQTVQVTTRNCGGQDLSDSQVVNISATACPYPLHAVAINGPAKGITDTLYTFIGVITPTNATPPITITWSLTPEIGQGTAVASYRWDTPGTKPISMTVENCGGELDTTHTITLSTAPPAGDAYEIDDVCRQAHPIPTDGTIQVHDFHDVGDSDWVAFQAISGTEYLIEAVTPSDSHADVALELYDDCDDLPTDDQDHAFSPDVRLRFTALADGLLYLHARNSYPDQAGPDVSYHLSVRSLAETATQGAVVIVAGRLRLADTLQNNIHNVTNQVYNLFLAHGYDKSRIYYLATNTSLDADGNGYDDDVDLKSNRANLEKALTQWATAPGLGLGPEHAFTLYLMDHGGVDRFYLDGSSQTVDPEDLDGWLDTLEAAAPGVRVNVIMEACHSGSFVPALSQEGRVVIASTATYAVAYATQQGARFSDTFLASLERGLSLYNSFEEARWTAGTAHPDQTPWLDDNGDGLWNPAVDGEEAARRGFAYAGTFDPTEEQWPPYIVWTRVDTENGDQVIKAKVEDNHGNSGVKFVWAVIYKPSYTPPPSEVEELPQENLPTVQLQDPGGDGIWGAAYNFDEIGAYRLVIYAADDEDLDARPKQLTLQTGRSVYLPLVLRE